MPDPFQDKRTVMTLDAGGTSFRFSLVRGGKPIPPGVSLPSEGAQLDRCLRNLLDGFSRIRDQSPEPPAAISFAFPGPADYPNGVIGDLQNLPSFRGGVALGPMLEERFGIPVFIHNDGDLFAFGESIAGLLPFVNGLLATAGSPKRYRNLLGVTLGTGFGGGLAHDGSMFTGDNSAGVEVWTLNNKLHPNRSAEEGVSARAVRRVYAELSGTTSDLAPEPKVIFEIGLGRAPGNAAAARESFRRLGEVAGHAIAQALALVDGLAVIGGGIAASWPLFLPALVKELNAPYSNSAAQHRPAAAFNLEDPNQLDAFLRGDLREIAVPGSPRRIRYDSLQRVGVGISRLGTTEAITLGAYSVALSRLDGR